MVQTNDNKPLKATTIRLSPETWKWWQENCLYIGYRSPGKLMEAIAKGDVEIKKKEKE
jgi:hypothetical protein